MARQPLLACVGLVVAVFTATPAYAQRIDAQVYFQHPNCGPACADVSTSSGGTISASNEATVVTAGAGGTLTTTASGAAQGSFGELHVGTAGAATFALIVDGSNTAGAAGDFDASAGITLILYGPGIDLPGNSYRLDLYSNVSSKPAQNRNTKTVGGVVSDVSSIFGTYILVIPYKASGNIGLSMTAFCSSSTRIPGGSVSYTESCDMSRGVRWGGIVSAVDINGAPVTLHITGSGGTDYAHEIGAVDRPPTASAGSDFPVSEGQVGVTLNGSGSADPDDDPLTYAWEQVVDGAPLVTLAGAATPQPTFTAPGVALGGEVLTFTLTVTANGRSAADAVSVSVVNLNHPPVADAGDDRSVAEGTAGVTLHGEDSFDNDNDPFTSTWTQLSGPVVTLTGANSASPTFTAPVLGSGGAPGVVATLVFELRVDDSFPQDVPADGYDFDDVVDTVAVEITNVNNDPTANADDDQTVDENASVALNAAGSDDPDNDTLSYGWTQTGGPAADLSGAGTVAPGFTAPFAGAGGANLTFEMTVTDGYGGTATDTVVVHVQNINDPPLASAARPTVASLWPPNHQMVSVGIVGVTDPNSNATITITGVTQDEPINGQGDGDTAIDAVINADGTVLLRAERSGGGDGRVYRIAFTASDPEGSSSGVVIVTVPPSAKKLAIDGGGSFDSTH